MTEVRCYHGLRALREGKKNVARDHFRWVTEHGNASYTEYAISLIQLDRLEKKYDSFSAPTARLKPVRRGPYRCGQRLVPLTSERHGRVDLAIMGQH
jgi:hypothetical protein